MKRLGFCFFFALSLLGSLSAREFTVLVYNVENLFDLDGVALYAEYEQGEQGNYGPQPLLNKLESIRRTLAAFNEGEGPEIILFQELELDRTPYRTPDAAAFLERTRGISLEALILEEGPQSNLPAELLLLKYLDDHGMAAYHIAQPDPLRMESHPPHKNVVFSRFPVEFVRQRPSLDARDLVVAGINVEGHSLVVMNNHWKSGASRAATEPIRVQNARVVRAELEAILFENPRADVIIAGDLNCYYNHKAAFPELPETAVNDVLRANGYESRLMEEGPFSLYNLWFELPPDQRGSEVWLGKWGTLMQMVLTPGLYDRRGIQYVDNSFDRLILPGENVETRWGRPIAWSNLGGGAGYSDHLPIYARFRVIPGPGEEGWMEVVNPTNEALDPYRPSVPYERMDRRAVPPVSILAEWDDAQLVQHLGAVFVVDAPLTGEAPPRIRVGGRELYVYTPHRSIEEQLEVLKTGDRVHFLADLDSWRGNLQVVIRSPSWWLKD